MNDEVLSRRPTPGRRRSLQRTSSDMHGNTVSKNKAKQSGGVRYAVFPKSMISRLTSESRDSSHTIAAPDEESAPKEPYSMESGNISASETAMVDNLMLERSSPGSSALSNTGARPRRKPGRPRKLYPVTLTAPPVLRPPGRPRKYQIDEDKAREAEEQIAKHAAALAAQVLQSDDPPAEVSLQQDALATHESIPGATEGASPEPTSFLHDSHLVSSDQSLATDFLNYGQDHRHM
jgi:hypothetical protein